METHNYNKIQQEKLERKHLINLFGQSTFRDRVKFLAVYSGIIGINFYTISKLICLQINRSQ